MVDLTSLLLLILLPSFWSFPLLIKMINITSSFWIPEENIDLRVRRDHVNYDLCERQGFIKTTEGNVVHYGFIENFIEELGMDYNIR